MINFGFMRAKIDSVASMAGGIAGVSQPGDSILVMVGASNALRAGINGSGLDTLRQELEKDYGFLLSQFRWWGLTDRLVVSYPLPVNENLCAASSILLNLALLGQVTSVISTVFTGVCPVADLSSGLCSPGGGLNAVFTDDGLHLNEEGYNILMNNILSFHDRS